MIYGRLNKCIEHYESIINCLGKNNEKDFFLSSDNSSESLLNDFIRLYNPKLYNNSPTYYDYDLNKYPNIDPTTNIHNMTSHFINKNRVLILVEEYINKYKIQYDCVVSLRADCMYKSNFELDILEDKTIYIPSGNDYEGINDQVAYGKIDVMKKYNSINVIDLLDKKLSKVHPESLTCANIRYHNLHIKRPKIDYYIDK